MSLIQLQHNQTVEKDRIKEGAKGGGDGGGGGGGGRQQDRRNRRGEYHAMLDYHNPCGYMQINQATLS